MLEIIYDPSLGIPGHNIHLNNNRTHDVQQIIRNHVQLHFKDNTDIDFYMIQNGRKLMERVSDGIIHVIPCLPGGKGGFGSMLRAIGAQIEKTTNREACRDLSGRRLRDINEEKRLKKWIAEQADREREAAERKKRKRNKMCEEPKHEFSDPNYDKARSEMVEKIHDAVEEGLKNIPNPGQPSTSENSDGGKKKKEIKGALWIDELGDLDDVDDSEDSEDETPKKKMKADAC